MTNFCVWSRSRSRIFFWSWNRCRSRPNWVEARVGSGTLGCLSRPKKWRLRKTFFLFDSTVLWCGTPVIWSALRYGLKDSLQEAYYLLYSLIDFYSTPRASDPNPQHWVRLSYIDPNSDPIFIFLMDSLSKSFESCLIQGFGAGLFWDGSGSW